jgi:hypothetical protein
MSTFTAGKNAVAFDGESGVLRGHLFLPAGFDPRQSYRGIVVGGTWTSVKEQMSDRYAERLARQGFVALDYDFSYYGESDGEPRQYESPMAKMEDNRNAIGFLLSLPFVDERRIGALGICASAGYMSGTVASDARVKSLALVAPWLHNAELTYAVYGGQEGVLRRIDVGNAARKKYEEMGEVKYVPACSATDENAAMYGPLDFYLNPERGALPQWTNRFAVMSWPEWLQFDGVQYGAQLSVPTVLVHSEAAALPDGARQFYETIPAPKEFVWTEGTQFDFYDQEPQVTKAVAVVSQHFEATLP